MSCYGYPRLTTPHLDRFAREGTLFENLYSAHIPTTSAYGSMLTGMDAFSTQVIALRHKGPLRPEVQTLPEILREAGYDTSCVGFSGNPSSRGFDTYLDYAGWGSSPPRPAGGGGGPPRRGGCPPQPRAPGVSILLGFGGGGEGETGPAPQK